MLDPSLKNILVETLSGCIKIKEMDEIGKMLNKKFDIYALADRTAVQTMGLRSAATVLVDFMESCHITDDLIKLLAELDNNQVLGRTLQLEGFDYFLQQLTKSGYFYDFSKRKVLPIKNDSSELQNWGALKDGKSYPVTVISVDIVSNSELVKKYGSKTMKKVYTNLWKFLKRSLTHTDGRIWTWAGDGGILAFSFKNHVERSVLFAIEVQRTIALFNMDVSNPISDPIHLRLGIHTGKLTYHNDTGQIVSEVINLAAHLEKKKTEAGGISITNDVHKGINSKLQSIFSSIGDFESVCCYQTESLDLISC
ncbi:MULTISPECIES: adenylate/guanylate cyclase domain-containing protein [unclassified Oceanispirochaeta]|uniref:adenylate/guanylate cyclase domain-containing protein n=1 Tax=unclassified Oceanispirochaeta TaxID=2635722 RepID=UPI0013144521|nr:MULTISPECIES: adenylate/guanylate cyclase domain-containing protein [unclassified Oceanispirochaeta]MBF9014800.1 adenylate/guanylate cyclase domain-containing protein [Oceanispirochaeta sp. M2]NPD71056.1 adenylate/guanylate cyclase domain-containing protein [Oceanispirochaeta sp. M1]